MSEQSTVPATGNNAPRRFRKRITIPATLLGLLVFLSIYMFIKGTWADATPRNPSRADEGVITQLYQGPRGKQIRCALVIDFRVEDVWAVITDYAKFSEIFPHVCHTEFSRDADGTCNLVGTAAASIFGNWPFEVRIAHTESSAKYVAEWDNPSADLPVNRGSWTLTPLDNERTLAVYTLEAAVGRFPDFIVRDALLMRIGGVVTAVAREVEKRHGKPA
jgi:hypothetical protein